MHIDEVTSLRIKAINLESELKTVKEELTAAKDRIEFLENDVPKWKTYNDQTFITVDSFFNLRRAWQDKITHLEKMLNGK
jgi:hypothetical protein